MKTETQQATEYAISLSRLTTETVKMDAEDFDLDTAIGQNDYDDQRTENDGSLVLWGTDWQLMVLPCV